MKDYGKLGSSMADYIFHTARLDGTMCADIVRLFLRHYPNDAVKKAMWTSIRREHIPAEYLAEFNEYWVKWVLER